MMLRKPFRRRGAWPHALAAVLLLLAACDRSTGTEPRPAPSLSTVTPMTPAQGGGDFWLTVNGGGFVRESVVRWNGADRRTTSVSSTQLTALIPGEDVAEPGSAEVTVFTPPPGGGVTESVTLQIRPLQNAVPTVTSVSPAAVMAGVGGEVTVRGTGFVPETRVWLPGILFLPITFVSQTELRFSLAPAHVPAARNLPVWVVNPAPGGGESPQPGTLAVHNPQPVVSLLTPALAMAGQDSAVVRLTGTGFVAATQVSFKGATRPAVFVSPSEMRVTLRAADLDEAGTFPLTAVNPAPGGGASAGVPLALAAPQPVLTMLPSEGATAGGGGFTLRVHGRSFVRGSVVRWNGADRATRYVDNTRLEIDVPAGDVASTGTASLTVHTPGGGTSQAAQMTIRARPAATRTSLRTITAPAVDMVYDPHSARLYASLGATGARSNRILVIDPAAGTVVDSLMLPGDPGSLAVSDDGSALWVELNATRQIVRVALPSLTPGLTFSTGGHIVAEMRPQPGEPNVLAVALENPSTSPRFRGVAVFDNGVRRAVMVNSFLGPGTITWGEDGSVLYGADGETSTNAFHTMRVDGAGVAGTRETGGIGGPYLRIFHANGRVYATNGAVIDAGRHERVGAFPGGTPHVGFALMPDARLGRVFYVNDGVFTAYDMNTLQPLGSFTVGAYFVEHPANSRLRVWRWAADGLAYRVDNRIVIFRTPLAGP